MFAKERENCNEISSQPSSSIRKKNKIPIAYVTIKQHLQDYPNVGSLGDS